MDEALTAFERALGEAEDRRRGISAAVHVADAYKGLAVVAARRGSCRESLELWGHAAALHPSLDPGAEIRDCLNPHGTPEGQCVP